MNKYPFKRSRRSTFAAPSYRSYLPLQGFRCESPGIEVHSTESRCKVPLIEVHITEAFLFYWGDVSGTEVQSTGSRREALWIEVTSTERFNLNWCDAQTWLGLLVVHT